VTGTRYLDSMETADQEQQATIDPAAVQAALEKLRRHPEPEVGFMPVARANAPAYNVQTAVDAEHALIVAHDVCLDSGDKRQLEPMAKAALAALGVESLNVVADAGYSNGEQAAHCEEACILPHIPVIRNPNTQGGGAFFNRDTFQYDPELDVYLCPAQHVLRRKGISKKDKAIRYRAHERDCGACAEKIRCTTASQRQVLRLLHEDALERMHQRATPALMKLRRCTVEHPFGTLKYRIFGYPRLLLRGTNGARTEMSLAIMTYNLKRMVNIVGVQELTRQFAKA